MVPGRHRDDADLAQSRVFLRRLIDNYINHRAGTLLWTITEALKQLYDTKDLSWVQYSFATARKPVTNSVSYH